ncbi:MAG TPA: 2OG-Fe(II) oxygenase [Pyrinomonadaceae bacterium]|nr:2OG-Fe(II) oxygenase [Pyrinomonadaceae bacterium]
MDTGTQNSKLIDWQYVASEMEAKGFVHLKRMLTPKACDDLIENYDKYDYRKTVVMERHRFGLGEYKYFNYPLPELIQKTRTEIYPKLAPIANEWAERLNLPTRFPYTFAEMQKLCHDNGQTKPTPLILKYGKGGFNTLHQDLYGDVYFPIQLAFFLNEPGEDYEGGEFVLTEQVPRAQSKAIVLRPRKGDMIIFTTNCRPVKGSRGYYRAAMRHGVSEVSSGERHTLGVIFHDATT